jgi:hypothetical protein
VHLILLQTNAAEGAESFFDSPWWNFITLMTRAVLVALWLALVYWTYKDAKRRISDPLMIGISVATSFIFPYIGTLFYAILRPPEYLEDVEERELEIQAKRLEMSGASARCPSCRVPVMEDYLVCPNCRQQLKVACNSCGKPMEPAWGLCPFCATEVGAQLPAEEEDLFP